MLGRHAAVARWHHRIRLIPGWLLDRLCDRLDEAYGLYDDDDFERAGISRQRAEDWDSAEDGVYDG